MADEFDFIIVGGGTSGPVVANRLANSPSKPKVLILEGGLNGSTSLHHPDLKFAAFINPALNWGFKSMPQPQLDDRDILCPTGRGLGGSSAINFGSWLLGHREDFNQWADIVGDDTWKWDIQGGVKERFRKIEAIHDNLDDDQSRIVSRDAIKQHSTSGMVDLSYNQVWSTLEWQTFKAAEEFGEPLNGDLNSGDPTGFGLAPTTFYKGLRVTGATAYLSAPSSNLTIVTDTFVSRVLFDNSKTAVAVNTTTGKTYLAKKEIIISCGAIDSPKLLLLSGIGPADELSKLSIPVIHNLPGVGKNLIDHCFTTTTLLLKPKSDSKTQVVEQPTADPQRNFGAQTPMAWLTSPTVKSSPEFLDLSNETQTFLQKLPSFELITTSVPLGAGVREQLTPGAQVITFIAAVMNPQSTGSVTLASTNPSEPPNIDVGYLSHPYDRRVAIEALRTAMAFSNMPAFAAATKERIEGPLSSSDADHFDHVKQSITPVWHYGGSCRMGKIGNEKTVVDASFRILGVKGLRVVDHSVAPLMLNNHTQSTAYLIGESAAEKIIAEYKL